MERIETDDRVLVLRGAAGAHRAWLRSAEIAAELAIRLTRTPHATGDLREVLHVRRDP